MTNDPATPPSSGHRHDPPGVLVDPAWLGPRLGQEGLRVVDLRDVEAYEDGHIPGAVRLDLEELGRHVGGCDNVLLGPVDFAALMARLGVGSGHAVVAYDDHWGLAASRLVWALHHYGEAPAAILNGGWDLWAEEGRAVETVPRSNGPEAAPPPPADGMSVAPPPPGDGTSVARLEPFEARPKARVAASRSWIVESLERDDVVLLDTRGPLEFEEGHLPGAVSWDWFNAVPSGSWECSRDPGEIREELAALGVHPGKEVVAYCRSGMRAAHTYVTLLNAGFTRVRLYDGSWQEWHMNAELGSEESP